MKTLELSMNYFYRGEMYYSFVIISNGSLSSVATNNGIVMQRYLSATELARFIVKLESGMVN